MNVTDIESNAFSSSIESSSSGIFCVFVSNSMSYRSLMLPRIQWPLINPVCSSLIITSSTLFMLLTMQQEAILQIVINSVIGRQLLRNRLSLPGLGMQVITPLLCVTENCPVIYASFIALRISLPTSILPKKFTVCPSKPGLLLFFIPFTT